MSKRINVNPDHYKVAGRERPGNAVAKAPKDQADDEKARERWQRSRDHARGRQASRPVKK
jgi:hypothetical protein